MLLQSVAERSQDTLFDVLQVGLPAVVIHVPFARNPGPSDGAGGAADPDQESDEAFNVLGWDCHADNLTKVLTGVKLFDILGIVNTKTCTTREAAKAVGITRATLQAWIAKGKLKAPRTQLLDGRAMRLWKQSDIAALRRVKAKVYMKEMGRPRKKA